MANERVSPLLLPRSKKTSCRNSWWQFDVEIRDDNSTRALTFLSFPSAVAPAAAAAAAAEVPVIAHARLQQRRSQAERDEEGLKSNRK